MKQNEASVVRRFFRWVPWRPLVLTGAVWAQGTALRQRNLSGDRDRVVLRNYEGKIFEYIEGANPAPAFKRSENFDSPEFV